MTVQAQAAPTSFVEMDGNIVKDGTGTYDWSNSGTRTSTATTAPVGTRYNRPDAGGLFDGGTFINSTTPPLAPSRTTAAAADTSIADAVFKPDPLSVDVTGCGTGDPTAYTGAGSEVNGGIISTDTFGTSSVPNKDDLSNVYAVAHLSSTANEVFFGGERVSNNGDSHIDYEFLQSTVTIPNACSGSFSGHRTRGDFLASIDFTSGGTFGGQHIYKWVCGNVTPNATTLVCDPNKSKAGPHYEEVTDNNVLSALKVNVNGGGALDCGGWACRNADGTSAATIPTNGLMEGGIDLGQLGFTGCISTFLPHTRSSQSFTAVLKDFEIIPFNTCAHPTITTAIADANGPLTLDANGVAHVSLGAVLHDTSRLHNYAGTPTGSVTYRLYTAAERAAGCLATAGTSLTPTPNALVNGVPPDSTTFTFNNAGTFYFVAAAAFTDNRNLGTPNSGCSAEPVVVAPATPAPHSTPVVQIKDTLRVTGFSSNATGNVIVGLYTNSACTTRASGTSDETFSIANASAAAGVATSFVTVTAGTYYYKISYAGDNNNTQFSDCTESVGVTITSLS